MKYILLLLAFFVAILSIVQGESLHDNVISDINLHSRFKRQWGGGWGMRRYGMGMYPRYGGMGMGMYPRFGGMGMMNPMMMNPMMMMG